LSFAAVVDQSLNSWCIEADGKQTMLPATQALSKIGVSIRSIAYSKQVQNILLVYLFYHYKGWVRVRYEAHTI
jgi:hypothetical protein